MRRTPLELIQELIALADDDERSLAHFAPDAEVQPVESTTVLHGLDEIRAYAAEQGPEVRPQLQSCMVHEVGDRAVVLTTLAFHRVGRDGRPYTEIKPVGFVVTTRDGKVTRVAHYETWSGARRAAALPDDAPAPKRLPLPRGLLSVAGSVAAALRAAVEPPTPAA